MSDLRDRIIGADDRPYEDTEVEEWDATVRVRGLSGQAAETFSRKYGTADGEEVPENMITGLLVVCIEDPDTGERIFGDEDVDALGAKSGKVLTRLFRVAQRLSGLGSLEEAKNA